MARAGLCSRRDAEAWIAAGRVAVNGGTISSPAMNVTARDRITVDGKPLPRRERTRLFLYHKPVGLVSTNADPQGRPTVFDALPKSLPRLLSVGRLDIGTEGLLLLTNDGGLARVLELPGTAWVRRYRVRAHGRVSQGELDKLRDGITIEGIHYGPIEATLEREQGANVWLSFAIREGKNREVRNVLRYLGLRVNRLIRVEFGPFGLGELGEGALEEVETGNLRKQLGAKIIDEADCDFIGPIAERRPSRHRPRSAGARRWRFATGDDRATLLPTMLRCSTRRDDHQPFCNPAASDERPKSRQLRPPRPHSRKDDAHCAELLASRRGNSITDRRSPTNAWPSDRKRGAASWWSGSARKRKSRNPPRHRSADAHRGDIRRATARPARDRRGPNSPNREP
jgi:23S rRNA pseudouridine2605 synthase